MKVVIVSGPPAAGKTAISHKIADSLGYEYYSKDYFKEQLFDSESRSKYFNWKWYDDTAYERLIGQLNECISNDQDIIIESNFLHMRDPKWFEESFSKVADIREVHVTARGWTLLKRFISRNGSGKSTNHPAHHDRIWYPFMVYIAVFRAFGSNGIHGPMGVTSNLLKVDTTDFGNVDLEGIVDFCS